MTVNRDSPYLIPTLLGLAAVNSKWMVRERDADVGEEEEDSVAGSMEDGEVGLGVVMPMYCTVTCWRSKWGFLGFTARMMIRTTARTTRARKEKSKKRQQQQPRKEAEEEDDRAG